MLQNILFLIVFMILVIPMGKYLYQVANCEKAFGDRIFNKVDNTIYKIFKIDKEEMNWKQYVLAIIITNAVMIFAGYLILRIQGIGLFNPSEIGGMEESLSFNTIISFMTNTNLQHYSGESGLSYLAQMLVIIYMMFTSAATGYAACMAFIRGLVGKKKTLGNFYVDMVRITTRVLVPLAFIVGVLLISQGVPQTLGGTETVRTIEGNLQDIARGPVAALESIKHVGTNGGGFFGANSSHPFENPTIVSNMIEMLSMMILPGACVIAFGYMIGNKKQSKAVFGAMGIIFLVGLLICWTSEKAGNPELAAAAGLSQAMGNMEGKELRFGIDQSALFTTVTTSFTTGTVNNMHDTLTPLGGLVPMLNMMLNVVFGGKGVGLMNMLMYAILTVFLCGLMVGRTPEFLSKKLEGREVKLVALSIIVHPLLILAFSALAVAIPAGLEGITNGGFHGLSQILYEFSSASANNGSGFEGLADNTLFWNMTTGVAMFYGRYLAIVIQLAVVGSLANKKPVNTSVGTLKTDNFTFTILLVAIVLIIGALTFLPALVLGPIAEHLTIWA